MTSTTRPTLGDVLAAATSNAGRAVSHLEMRAMAQSFVMALAGLRFSNVIPVGEDIILRDGIEKLIVQWDQARVDRTCVSTYDPLAEFTAIVNAEAGK